jgi:hypothetical protein
MRVIIGPDLVMDGQHIKTVPKARDRHDKTMKGFVKMHRADPESAAAAADQTVSRNPSIGDGWFSYRFGITNDMRLTRAYMKRYAKEKGATLSRNPLIFLAPRPGLEPGTYGLTVRRSTD